MRAAYDALDDGTRDRISNLCAYHSLFYSQGRIGHEPEVGAGYGFYGGEKPLRPLVKVHSATARPALYIGRHAYGIPGLPEEESERLLTSLAEFACQPPRTYLHEWQVGDTAIWDNRCVMHRARPCDADLPRVLVHTRVAGDPATELAPGMTPQQLARQDGWRRLPAGPRRKRQVGQPRAGLAQVFAAPNEFAQVVQQPPEFAVNRDGGFEAQARFQVFPRLRPGAVHHGDAAECEQQCGIVGMVIGNQPLRDSHLPARRSGDGMRP